MCNFLSLITIAHPCWATPHVGCSLVNCYTVFSCPLSLTVWPRPACWPGPRTLYNTRKMSWCFNYTDSFWDNFTNAFNACITEVNPVRRIARRMQVTDTDYKAFSIQVASRLLDSPYDVLIITALIFFLPSIFLHWCRHGCESKEKQVVGKLGQNYIWKNAFKCRMDFLLKRKYTVVGLTLYWMHLFKKVCEKLKNN